MGRFATTAELYAQFRPPYSAEFFRRAAERLDLQRKHALLDIGTGPALLALGFGPFVGRVTAVDPEATMIAAARKAIARADHDIRLIECRAEDLPEDAGRFDVVTIGRALHWIDRNAFGSLFDRLVVPGGEVVVCGSSSVGDGRNPWLESYNAARRAWSDKDLESEAGKGQQTHRELMQALERAGFRTRERLTVEFTHAISARDLARRVLTFSSSSPAVLGDNANAMLADVEARLLPFSQDGMVRETVVSAADIASRDG